MLFTVGRQTAFGFVTPQIVLFLASLGGPGRDVLIGLWSVIHFFPKFANAAQTSFGDALRGTGAQFRIFDVHVRQDYRRRSSILFRYYPALIRASLAAAHRSLQPVDGKAPDAVVISSDVEVIAFTIMRLWLHVARPAVVFLPFILTQRRSPLVNRLRLFYYRAIIRQVALAICHSQQEVNDYRRMFAGCGAEFAFIHWGCFVPSEADIIAAAGPLPRRQGHGIVVSAGKSGRDYPTLVAATSGLDCRTIIVSNDMASLVGVKQRGNVDIMQQCFGMDYLWQLLRADVVVVPLRVNDISAGQMVFVQAMALGRPLIVTAAASVGDYLEDGKTALLVPVGDKEALRAAITRLLSDRPLAEQLGRNARASFMSKLSEDRHIRQLVDTVQTHCGINPGIPGGPQAQLGQCSQTQLEIK